MYAIPITFPKALANIRRNITAAEKTADPKTNRKLQLIRRDLQEIERTIDYYTDTAIPPIIRPGVVEYLRTLSDREQTVAIYWHKLTGRTLNNGEILGEHYGVTGERISQIAADIDKKVIQDIDNDVPNAREFGAAIELHQREAETRRSIEYRKQSQARRTGLLRGDNQ